jgi:hypothetical protein
MEIFHLKIRETEAGQYSVLAEDVAPHEEAVVSFAPNAAFNLKLEGVSERGPNGIETFAQHEKLCREIGATIFTTFFQGAPLEQFRAYMARIEGGGSRPRIAIYIPHSLFYLPWEIICDPTDQPVQFLSLRGSVTRFDINSAQNADNVIYSPPESATFMFFLASPSKRPIGDFEPPDKLKQLSFDKVRPASFNNFIQRLNGAVPYGLIFFGHGDISKYQGSDCGSLVFVRQSGMFFKYLDDDPIFGPRVCAAIAPIAKKTRIVWLAACESAWAINKLSFDRSVTGSILDRTRVAFVIGAQTSLDFFAAQTCLEATFNSILSGDPLDIAISNGRIAIQAINPDGAGQTYSWRDWWVPVLYAKTTSFEVLPVAPAVALPTTVPRDEMPVKEVQSLPQSRSDLRDMFTALIRSVGKSL